LSLAQFLPSAVRVRIRSRSTSAKPPSTASIKRPVLVPVSAHGSASDLNRHSPDSGAAERDLPSHRGTPQ
jgi:hypothetical protein